MGHWERLSALDASFLEIEDANSHMHVAAALLFDAGPLRGAATAASTWSASAPTSSRACSSSRATGSGSPTSPSSGTPSGSTTTASTSSTTSATPRLPRPGEERQLKRLCGRILSQKLDLTKPLWEIWVVEGLAGRPLRADRQGAPLHGRRHLGDRPPRDALLSPVAEACFEPAPPWRPRPAPTAARPAAGRAVRRRLAAAPRRSRAPGAAARAGDRAGRHRGGARRAAGLVETFGEATSRRRATPLNPAIGPHRRFDWLRLDLDDGEGGQAADSAARSTTSCSRRSSAPCRRFLSGRGDAARRARLPRPDPGERAGGERSAARSATGWRRCSRGCRSTSPIRGARFARVVEATTQLKHSHQVRGDRADRGARRLDGDRRAHPDHAARASAPTYNLIVTNVPGPPMPLYLLGAPLRESYPMVPLFSQPGRRHRALQLRGRPLLGPQRRLGRDARPARPGRGAPPRVRGAASSGGGPTDAAQRVNAVTVDSYRRTDGARRRSPRARRRPRGSRPPTAPTCGSGRDTARWRASTPAAASASAYAAPSSRSGSNSHVTTSAGGRPDRSPRAERRRLGVLRDRPDRRSDPRTSASTTSVST